MTALLGQPAPPADLDADTRLAAAIATLCEPARLPVHRVDPILDEAAAALLAGDRATERELEQRHAAHLRARRHGQATRALAALMDHRRRAAERRDRIAAIPDDALVPALLVQLEAETASSSGLGSGGRAGPYRSIIAATAVELVAAIRRGVGHRHGQVLVDVVRDWAGYHDDPATAADLATRWAEQIRGVLDPPKRWHHPGACPDCGHRTAHVPDDSGQLVRQPAIEFDRARGTARCLRCPARWTTEAQLLALNRVLEEQQHERM